MSLARSPGYHLLIRARFFKLALHILLSHSVVSALQGVSRNRERWREQAHHFNSGLLAPACLSVICVCACVSKAGACVQGE